jgi:hypothetical protein
MKSNLVLVIGAIMALIIAVGCSNDSRTTAPAGVDNSFNLPNGDSVNRFSDELALSRPQPIGGDPVISKIGFYHITARGCQSIQIKNDSEIQPEEYIELTFNTPERLDIESGSLVLVKGEYHRYPGNFCMLPTSIQVEVIQTLAESTSDPVEQPSGF